MWGSSREINSKSKFGPNCVCLKHHKACDGKKLNISGQEVILSPLPLSSSWSPWLLLTCTMRQELSKGLYKVGCYNTCFRNKSEKVLAHMWFFCNTFPFCSIIWNYIPKEYSKKKTWVHMNDWRSGLKRKELAEQGMGRH